MFIIVQVHELFSKNWKILIFQHYIKSRLIFNIIFVNIEFVLK
jgi:hypothetical protein